MLTPHRVLLAAYVVLAAALIAWDVIAGGRMLRNRRLPRMLAGATALGALLLLPALVAAVSDASLVYGRATQPVAWLWPAVAVLFLAQALLALGRGLVNPALGVPIAVYDALVATVALARFLSSRGIAPPDPMLIVSAAQTSALGTIGGTGALSGATWLLIPMFAPALAPFSRVRRAVRWVLTAGVSAAAALVLLELPAATETIDSYARYQHATVLERPDGNFAFGLKVFPDLRGAPPPVAISKDLALADSLAVDAVLVEVMPEAARGRPLDSLAHVLDNVRGDSTTLIIALGYPAGVRPATARSAAYTSARLADVNRLARALHPNVLIPAVEPYGAGARALGVQPPSYWIAYLTRAAAIAHHVNPNIQVAVAAASYGPRDSTLYVWASGRGSPLDIAGFSLMPGFDGATSLDTHLRIAQRWLQTPGRVRPAWVFAAGGYPIAHGEQSQELALRGVLAWATAQPAVQGAVVTQAGDYDSQTGLRAPTGRLRPAFAALAAAIRTERENAAR